MASIWKHPNSPYYMACYTNHLGKRVKKTTKQTGRREAQKVADEFEEKERSGRKKHLTTIALQRFASELAQKLTGESIDVPTVEGFFNDWIESKRTRKAATGTIERYSTTKKLFLNSLKEMRSAPINAIGPRHIEKFLKERLNGGAASKTVVVDIKILRTALNQAFKWGYTINNPASMILLPEVESHQRELFSIEDIKKLFETAREEESEWATMILLGATTGARLKDCANMRWENINWDSLTIKYTQAKTGKSVEVPLHPDLDDHLDYDAQRPAKTGFPTHPPPLLPPLAAV